MSFDFTKQNDNFKTPVDQLGMGKPLLFKAHKRDAPAPSSFDANAASKSFGPAPKKEAKEKPSFTFGFGSSAPAEATGVKGTGFIFGSSVKPERSGATAAPPPDFWDDKEADDSNSPEFVEVRKLRSVSPDVIVIVGGVEYECFKVALCCASEYFDTLIESGTQEDNTCRIELKDKDPKEWEIFYQTIDPLLRISEVRPDDIINDDNAVMLTRWFHEFHMTSHLKECDAILEKKFIAATHWRDRKKLQLDKSFWKSVSRKESFMELIDLLKHSFTYNLRRTSYVANKTFGYLLEHELHLFTTNTVKTLVDLCIPVCEDSDGSYISEGKCNYLWKNHLSTFVNDHKDDLTVDMINNNDMFPLLLHAYMQQSMKDKQSVQHHFDFGQFGQQSSS